MFSIKYLRLWPALAIHVSAQNNFEGFPSIKRVAAIAHIRETDIVPIMHSLANNCDALTIWKEKNGKIKYRLETDRIKLSSFPIGRCIVENGLWAGLRDSEILVYCAMLAFACAPSFIVSKKFYHKDKKLGRISSNNMRLLSETNLEYARKRCEDYYEPATIRRANKNLFKQGFILYHKDNLFKGLVLPYRVEGKNEKLLARLDKIKEQSISRRAKVFLTYFERQCEQS